MDVGLITLDQTLGYQTGWFSYYYNNSPAAFASGTVFNTAGYPASNGYDGLKMKYSSGRIDGLSSGGGGIMFHDPSITIYGGQSGSPVWSPADGVVYGVAVSDSFAIRITQPIYNQLQSWVAGDTPPHAPVRVAYAPPSIQGSSYSVAPGGSLTLSQTQLLAGSYDPQGLSLTAYNVTYSTRGTLTKNGDGSYTYTPYPWIYGSDTFTIQATDGRQLSNVATITIYVPPPPVSLPWNSMLLVTFGSGDLYQYNTAPALFTGGVKSASAARGPNGDMYYLVVFANGDLYRYDKTGVSPLYGGVKSASIAIDPSGSPAYDVVFTNGDLYHVSSTGVTGLYGGVNFASLTYSPSGAVVREIVFANNDWYRSDASGVYLVSGGVQSVSSTFMSNGRLAYEIVYLGGWLSQFDESGAKFLYGGVKSATLVNMYVTPSSTNSKALTSLRTSAPAPVATTRALDGVALVESQRKEKAVVVGAGRWARAETPGVRWGIAADRPRRASLATAGSARSKPWGASTITS